MQTLLPTGVFGILLCEKYGTYEHHFFVCSDTGLTNEELFEALNGEGPNAIMRSALPRSLSVGDYIIHDDEQAERVDPVGWTRGIVFVENNQIIFESNERN